ncbi:MULTISPECIES: hypothetical protein [unclassified Streptomyces]|uniref:hypothetical protein n=1 Tax=unclassified Streptomyces TaxID=2593676 RepID=UPI003333EB3C
MLGRLGGNERAQHLDWCLAGEAVPETPAEQQMLMAAEALRPRTAISETARARARAAMLREAARVGRTAEPTTPDLSDPGVNVRVARLGPAGTLRVADIEPVNDDRLEDIARNIAERLGQRAHQDRNP